MMEKTIGTLDTLPRVAFSSDPTPLEFLPNLTAASGANIYAKRDDSHALAFGGNKVRQLEYYFGAARKEGADTVLITGAVQSNFCRLTAAFAAKLGMECHIQMEERVPKDDPVYRQSGNVLIEQMLGAHLHSYPHGEDEAGADARLEELAAERRKADRTPYVIHLAPGHPPIGALGYVRAARETLEQLAQKDIEIDAFVVPSGSGATHGGFLFGLRALGCTTPVKGVCVRRPADQQAPRIASRCGEIAKLLGVGNPVTDADVDVTDAFLAPGYGQLNAATEEAILRAARTEALMLDPVYSGKTMAAVLALAGGEMKGRSLLFLHTGGTPAIFAYQGALSSAAAHQA